MVATLLQYTAPIMYRGLGAPNVLQRIAIPESLRNNRTLFHKYIIVDGDRPDTIADHYYGSPLYDWVVALSNNMVSYYDEWPLQQVDLNRVITKQYGSVQAAEQLISHYRVNHRLDAIPEVVYDALAPRQKQYWSKKSISSPAVYSLLPSDIEISADSFEALAEEERIYWEAVSAFDVAFEANERKRAIKLLDARAVPELERTLRQLSDG